MSIMRTVLHSPNFMVITHVCRHPRVDCGESQGDEPARMIFTRRGSFAVHAGGKTCYARPGQAVLVRKHVEYRISHPDAQSCDCCTDVWIDDAVLDTLGIPGAVTQPCMEFAHDLRFQQAHVEMLLGLQRGRDAGEDADAVLFDTFACLLRAGAAGRRPRNPAAARQVARVQEAILGQAERNLGVEALARIAGCSPFHLCRIFRDATGQSLRRFRLQNRIGTALGRLGDGERDLAALACDLGFSSHSHMTDAFRELLGASPREVRDELRRSDLRRLRAKLNVPPSAGFVRQ